jgi:outer membrane protein assembly factor BamB/orotate phosphoribosyltransferase
MLDIKDAILNYSIKLAQDFEKTNWSYRFDNRNFLLNAPTELINKVGKMLWDKIKDLDPDIIFGTGVGAMPLLSLVKATAYAEDNKDLRILFVRDSRKKHGTRKIVEGAYPEEIKGLRTVFVDDLFDLGRTFERAKNALLTEGFELDIIGSVAIVDFWKMDGSRKYNAQGFACRAIFRRHDFGLTRDERFLPELLVKLKWRKHIFHDGPNIMPHKGSPAVYKNYLLVGNDNNHHYCFDKETGDTLWVNESRKPQPKGDCSITQFHDDYAYWTSYDGTVKCADVHTGNVKWTVKADFNIHSSVCLDPDNNRLFLGTEWNKFPISQGGFGLGDVVCLNMSNGHELWRYRSGGMIPATPSYSPKRNCVISGSNDFHVHILDADTGKLLKKIPTRGEVKGRPAINSEETICVASTVYGYVYGIDLTTMEVIWQQRAGHHLYHDYPHVEGNRAYFANNTNIISCVDINTGKFIWLRQVRSVPVWKSVDLGPALLYVFKNGQIITVNKETGEKMSNDTLPNSLNLAGAEIVQPPAFDGKTLYIVTNNKGIIAYDIDTSRLQTTK